MNPTHLSLRNVASFADLDLEIPPGCLSLTGTNGAGKSTLMQAIEIALFGPRSRSLAPLLRLGEDELMIELDFTHMGDRYRVRRGYSARGRGKTTLDLEIMGGPNDDQWAAFTQANAADTQEFLERQIGLTRETWLCSAYLAQGDGGAFTEAQPKDRKRILANALALSLWDEASAAISAHRRHAQAGVSATEGRIATLADRVASAEGLAADKQRLTVELEQADEALATATSTVEKAAEQAERAAAAVSMHRAAAAEHAASVSEWKAAADALEAAETAGRQLDGARADVSRIAPLADELVAKTAALDEAIERDRARVDALRERDRLTADHGRLAAAEQRHTEAVSTTGAKVARLASEPDPICPTCEQHLPDKARETALASLRAEHQAAEAALADARKQAADAHRALTEVVIPAPVEGIDQLRERCAELRDTPAQLATARARVTHLEQQAAGDNDHARTAVARLAAEVVARKDAFNKIPEPEPGAAEHAQAALLQARATQEAARTTRETTVAALSRVDALLDAARQDQDTLDATRADLDQQQARLADLETLEQAFGRDGVPAWIVEQHALPAIESEANRILSALGGPVTRIELRTERELKTGGTRDDALDIVCATDQGDRDYSTFSGGEKTRISIALRLALARLLAHRRDADIRLLCLDEPDGLDVAGTEALAGILRGLVQDGIVDTTILASHDTNLRDRFDQSLLVERTDRGSVVTAA